MTATVKDTNISNTFTLRVNRPQMCQVLVEKVTLMPQSWEVTVTAPLRVSLFSQSPFFSSSLVKVIKSWGAVTWTVPL